ncbi:phospholipid-transporting ATPase ID [Engraulis encrasicolus]|uniref:phospholipid-transporting ATPase ID n=1 Tax=Engraulis encrasicolus TaxID=184585 RepID=UPI002FD60E77
MTVPKDIPDKWFPMILPLQRKKRNQVAGGIKKRKGKEEERKVRANDREYNEKFQYASNCIVTSKYNVITFLPVNLFEQFQEVANTYFLFLLILQLIPQISSLSWFTTIVPLVLVLSITAVKDATDDYFRHKSDNQVNNRHSQVLINGIVQKEKWMNVKVGDIIKLENNQFVAADLLLLSSSEPHGLCYIETAELDGETNMKVRQSLSVTSELGDPNNLARFDGEVVCEPPNNKLDRFCGTLYWRESKYPLSNQNMLLRGCVLRNTEFCYGIVIFAGPDTKLMQNSGRTKFKRTSIDRLMNTLVLWIFGFLVCMGVILAVGNAVWEFEVGLLFQSFLPWEPPVNNALFSAFLSFWSYVIILNTVVPISLYVSVEVIRLGHSYFINWDRRMFCSRSNTPAEARTTTLNEELGQVEYIFSDKTGTLTQNIMTFNKCSINGHAYGDVDPVPPPGKRPQPLDFSVWNPLADGGLCFYDSSLLEAVKTGEPATQEFFRLLSLCHTVMSDEKTEGALFYKAQSPDEGALVTAARNFGYVFRSRTPGTITVQEMGKPVTYTLLAILDFNNIRKRMSVIVRNPEGRIRLYCKGADTVLFDRLHPCNHHLMNITSDHLNEYAGDGLRTLALAYRDLSEEEWEGWSERYRGAGKAADCREDRLAATYEEIEQDMMLLGATAIEDKLQEGVPETIAILSLANIKIWVLTGDKQETAVNIGYSCKMLTDDMTEIFIINGHTVQSVREELRRARERMVSHSRGEKVDEAEGWSQACSLSNGVGGGDPAGWPHPHPQHKEKQEAHAQQEAQQGREEAQGGATKLGGKRAPAPSLLESISGEFALVISGHSLAHALEGDMEHEFVETACACRAVICCRVTPLQKAQVVELIKRHKKAVTLAIGDGANDVSMIKTAHIGVGISGQEGIQAVLSSDYSFSQFRFLQRLLLVHGRWSYLRMCRFLCYFFYKNFAFTMVHFWFGFFCGFSAQTVYDQYFITLYNIVYTSLPVLAMGIFDQDVPEQRSLEYPKLYEPGQLNLLFNKREFFICIAQGIYTSVVLFFVPYAVLSHATQATGTPLADYQTFAVTTATALVIVVSVQIALDTGYWTAINHFFVWGSLGAYFTILFTMHSSLLFRFFPKQFHFLGSGQNTLEQPVVWLTIALATVICIAPVLAFRFLKLDLKPQLSDTVRYTQLVRQKRRKLGEGRGGAGVSGVGLGAGALGRLGRGGSRRSGYAFAHQEGFGELITSGKNMRLSSLALATFASRHSSSWIDTLRKKKHANAANNAAGASPAPSNGAHNHSSGSSSSHQGTPVPAAAAGPALSKSSSVCSQQGTPTPHTPSPLAQAQPCSSSSSLNSQQGAPHTSPPRAAPATAPASAPASSAASTPPLSNSSSRSASQEEAEVEVVVPIPAAGPGGVADGAGGSHVVLELSPAGDRAAGSSPRAMQEALSGSKGAGAAVFEGGGRSSPGPPIMEESPGCLAE